MPEDSEYNQEDGNNPASGINNPVSEMIRETIQQLLDIRKCVIFCHTDTDGDALGAGLALARFLHSLGKEADVAVDAEIAECFMYLDSMQELLRIIPAKDYDTYIAADCFSLRVLGKFSEDFAAFAEAGGITINIDHHAYNTEYAMHNCVAACSSCCELVTDIVRSAGWEPDKETANLLMLGLMTDSGRFTHMNVTENTFTDAAFLCAHGADPCETNRSIYGKCTRETERIKSRITGRTEYFCGGRIAVVPVRNTDLNGLADRSVTDGFEYLLLDPGVEVSVLLKEQEGGECYRAFLCSKTVDVQKVAESFGGSGGHGQAGSCLLKGTEEECRKKIVDVVSKIL